MNVRINESCILINALLRFSRIANISCVSFEMDDPVSNCTYIQVKYPKVGPQALYHEMTFIKM